jgi:hypothetical protein
MNLTLETGSRQHIGADNLGFAKPVSLDLLVGRAAVRPAVGATAHCVLPMPRHLDEL